MKHDGDQFGIAERPCSEGFKPLLRLLPAGDHQRLVLGIVVRRGLLHVAMRPSRTLFGLACPVIKAHFARWPLKAHPATAEAAERGA